MAPIERWNDDRLDEWSGRVQRIEQVVPEVAVMRSEMHSLTKELRANTQATKEVADQLEKAQREPLNRWRAFRSAAAVALVGAIGAGLFVLLGVLLSSH